MAKEKPEAADHVRVGCCKHGTLHITLHRADGTAYAVATMPLETALAFNQDTLDVMEAYATGAGFDCGGSVH